MLKFFNVRKRRLPAILIADASDINKKHKLEGKVTAESMMQFAEDFFAKRLENFKVSQEPVDDANATVKTLVNRYYCSSCLLNHGVDCHCVMLITAIGLSGWNSAGATISSSSALRSATRRAAVQSVSQ
jgi:hypothetical protein